ncbi:TetR/AcrR family transcriptional regulator [Jatrophihabitans sp.]|uniref:TetR/AcrR family transcriptional regulator n=1 Tax=Jatrophihabitans sp. TaxID=1932789 RepID=UPI0030C72C11|nr:TetR/AcrR family transcriptional regulator [Jatrophihabitans sp.]
MSSSKASKRSARDRLLEAADRLFYDEGIHAVGIDRVLEEAGVAKGSLYYNFGGKDDLVRTYLQNRHAKWSARLDEMLAETEDPDEKILTVFDALGDLFAEPDFNGCAFVNAAAEALPGSAEDLATKDFRTWLHELFGGLVAEAGHADGETLAYQLILLYDGANIAAQLDQNPAAARAARAAASTLLLTAGSNPATGKKTTGRSRP